MERNNPTFKILNQLKDEAYAIACEHGFHDEKQSDEHLLCLVVSELMEAVEADRHGNHADMDAYWSRLDAYPDADELFERYVKDTVEDELADAAIRLLDLAGLRGMKIEGNADDSLFKDGDVSDAELRFLIKGLQFTELMFHITRNVTDRKCDYAICDLFIVAEALNFDLVQHIKLKMNYNRNRPRLHGKKY